jgi:hypothetical protein
MNDNRILIVDSLLQQIAEELDIPPSKYEQAVERYTSVDGSKTEFIRGCRKQL